VRFGVFKAVPMAVFWHMTTYSFVYPPAATILGGEKYARSGRNGTDKERERTASRHPIRVKRTL
jgi:hypothetical protein